MTAITGVRVHGPVNRGAAQCARANMPEGEAQATMAYEFRRSRKLRACSIRDGV